MAPKWRFFTSNPAIGMAVGDPAAPDCRTGQLTRSRVALAGGVDDHPRSAVIRVHETVLGLLACADGRSPQRDRDHRDDADEVEDHLEPRVDPDCAAGRRAAASAANTMRQILRESTARRALAGLGYSGVEGEERGRRGGRTAFQLAVVHRPDALAPEQAGDEEDHGYAIRDRRNEKVEDRHCEDEKGTEPADAQDALA